MCSVSSYTCILRYILNCDKSAPRCPVCSKQVCQPDLKFVKISDAEKLAVERPCTLQLCCIRNGSLYPSPVGGFHTECHSSLGQHHHSHAHSHQHPHPHPHGDFEDLTESNLPFFSSDSAKFSRICVASVEDIHSIYAEERLQLLSYQSDCVLSSSNGVYSGIRGDVEHLPYIHFALECSAEREAALILQIQQCLNSSVAGGGVGAMAVVKLSKPATPSAATAMNPRVAHVIGEQRASSMESSNDHLTDIISAASAPVVVDTDMPVEAQTQHHQLSSTAVATHADCTYYYQLGNGENVFLHPLCLRIVLAAAEEKARTARIRANSSGSLDQNTGSDAVRRCRSDSSDGSIPEPGGDQENDHRAPDSSAGAGRRRRSARQVHLDSLLTSPVVELEVIKITLENRQRTPFFRHLSVGTAVTLVEIDLKPLVTAHVLNKFREELHARDKKRKQRLQQKLREHEMDEEARLVHEAYVQSMRFMQIKQEADLEHEFMNAPKLGAPSRDANEDPSEEDGETGYGSRSAVPVSRPHSSDGTKSFASITQVPCFLHGPKNLETYLSIIRCLDISRRWELVLVLLPING
jgi:hypothetical protein